MVRSFDDTSVEALYKSSLGKMVKAPRLPRRKGLVFTPEHTARAQRPPSKQKQFATAYLCEPGPSKCKEYLKPYAAKVTKSAKLAPNLKQELHALDKPNGSNGPSAQLSAHQDIHRTSCQSRHVCPSPCHEFAKLAWHRMPSHASHQNFCTWSK